MNNAKDKVTYLIILATIMCYCPVSFWWHLTCDSTNHAFVKITSHMFICCKTAVFVKQ